MKQKEYDAYLKLEGVAHTIRNTLLRENTDKEIKDLDDALTLLSNLQDYDMDKKYRELLKEGINYEIKINTKKSVTTLKKLPQKVPIGTRIFVENAARYFVKGIKKWVYLPTFYFDGARQSGKKIAKELFQDL